MTKEWLSNYGSVDDIRCHLSHMNPETPDEIRRYLEYLNENLDHEAKNKNRATVLKVIRTKINQLKKLHKPTQSKTFYK